MGLLSNNDIEQICGLIGISSIDSVSNTSNWCYFPVSDELTPWIHYEIINRKRPIGTQYEFHIECDAPDLINELSANGIKSMNRYQNGKFIYRLPHPNKSHNSSIKNLHEVIKNSINNFLCSYHNKYNHHNQYVETEQKKLSQLTHYNFFQGFSNGNHGPSENDHTRILMSMLKFCDGNMRVLESFFDKFGINENAQQVTSNDIFINKGYNSANDVIDGLILHNNGNGFAVIIENKVCGAADQKQQIKRYVSAIENNERISKDRIYVIYLTQDGSVNQGRPSLESCPEDLSTNLGDNLVCINYRYDILPWLKNTVYPRMKFSSIGWAIDNYIDYLESLFGEDPISKMVNANIKSDVLKRLSLTGMSDEKQARALDSVLKELQLFTKYDSLKNVLNSYFKS